MEALSQVSFTPAILLEPRGFIKVLEFVLSIFAFATTTSPDSSTTFTVKNCSASTNHTSSAAASRSFSYSYPYNLEETCFKIPVCPNSIYKAGAFCLLEGSQSSAQFYVFVGVIVFLYCLAALVLYVFFDELYRRNTRVVVVDFVVSCVLTLFWIIASSAWAAGLDDVKLYTDPYDGGIFKKAAVPECMEEGACFTENEGNFASLNVSIIFGFLNFVVWIGNLWFLYKETPWFKVQAKPPSQPDNYPASPGGDYPSPGGNYPPVGGEGGRYQ